jgi:hypothetical protein
MRDERLRAAVGRGRLLACLDVVVEQLLRRPDHRREVHIQQFGHQVHLARQGIRRHHHTLYAHDLHAEAVGGGSDGWAVGARRLIKGGAMLT